MIKFIFLIIATLVITYSVFGQKNYRVADIADSLSKDADVVYRFSKTSYKRISVEKYTTNILYAVTVLNSNGKHASDLIVNYDNDSKVSDIEGRIYDKNGGLLGKMKKKDVRDYASNNSYTLFSDNRVKYYQPLVSKYPYTVEYSYTVETKGVVGFDTWLPHDGFNSSVEKSELIFTTSDKFDIKYLELNYDFTRDMSSKGGEIVYKWSVENLRAIEFEPNAPNYLDFMPAVLLSPNEIEYNGTKGDFSSWTSYGKWVNKLIEGRDELSEGTIRTIRELTSKTNNKKDMVKAIYKYMQDRTRYVNVALGLGGFQPLLAADVDEKGYGDCKALSNYTKALLKCVDIDSYYAEIGNGKYQKIKYTDFASANQTNHIILCVPMDGDTTWLECTNQNIPFGFIGSGSQNRYALLIKPDGGELARTPSFNAKQNTRTANIKLNLNESGDADFVFDASFNNTLYFQLFGLLNSSEKEQKEELLKNLSSVALTIDNYKLEDLSDNFARATLEVKGNMHDLATMSGNWMFFSPVFFHRYNSSEFISNKRKLDIYEPISYSTIDTLQVTFPSSYSADSKPINEQFISDYGQYSLSVEQTTEAFLFIRQLTINQGSYGTAQFTEIDEFLRNVAKCDNKKIILSQIK